jgi:S1-C subfamily serine protease
MTLGNPLHFRGTVTVGIVSSVGRHLPERGGQVTNEFLQFSAPVNPGSSGSPVVDMAGNVIGITTRNHTEAQAIAFAVPSKVIKWVLAALHGPDGRVRRAHLGIAFDRLSRRGAERYGVPEGRGARIIHVREGSVAEGVGLAKGDVVLEYDGRSVTNVGELYDWITYSRPGTQVQLEVLRPGQGTRAVGVVLGELSTPAPATASQETEPPEVPAQ